MLMKSDVQYMQISGNMALMLRIYGHNFSNLIECYSRKKNQWGPPCQSTNEI